MNPSDQQLQQALTQQQLQIRKLNRTLWIGLPILALVLCFIVANYNILSTLLTFVVLLAAFIAVGIYEKNLPITLILVLIYCLADNYISYHYNFSVAGLKRQISMLVFIMLVHFGRTLAYRTLLKNDTSKPSTDNKNSSSK